jgi:hypothetical protein
VDFAFFAFFIIILFTFTAENPPWSASEMPDPGEAIRHKAGTAHRARAMYTRLHLGAPFHFALFLQFEYVEGPIIGYKAW